jgi:hypothetical protein
MTSPPRRFPPPWTVEENPERDGIVGAMRLPLPEVDLDQCRVA